MTEWDGQPYSAVVVASSPYVVLRIGAIYGNHDEWNGEDSDSRVENSLRSFKDNIFSFDCMHENAPKTAAN